jgi:hypothetical protein
MSHTFETPDGDYTFDTHPRRGDPSSQYVAVNIKYHGPYPEPEGDYVRKLALIYEHSQDCHSEEILWQRVREEVTDLWHDAATDVATDCNLKYSVVGR